MPKVFLTGNFTDEHAVLKAVRALRSAKLKVHDVFAPYPIHGLDQAMGIKKSRLPFATLIGGTTALVLTLGFQFFAAVWDWPMNVGGKPDNSTLAFIPITFELTVLLGGLCTAAALFLRARLFPGARQRMALDGVTDDRFAVVLRMHSDAENVWAAQDILERAGAIEVFETEAR